MGDMESEPTAQPTHSYARQARLEGKTALGKRLDELGRPNSWLARKVGVNRSTVGRWVKGTFAVPAEHQGKVARALGMRKAELFD
jgi:hypothetical protein